MAQSTYCYWNNHLQEKAEDLSYGKEKLTSVAGCIPSLSLYFYCADL